jgi:hypothetical protein
MKMVRGLGCEDSKQCPFFVTFSITKSCPVGSHMGTFERPMAVRKSVWGPSVAYIFAKMRENGATSSFCGEKVIFELIFPSLFFSSTMAHQTRQMGRSGVAEGNIEFDDAHLKCIQMVRGYCPFGLAAGDYL